MLHKRPKSGDILNLLNAKIWKEKRKHPSIIFNTWSFFLEDDRFTYGKFQAASFTNKWPFESTVHMFTNHSPVACWQKILFMEIRRDKFSTAANRHFDFISTNMCLLKPREKTGLWTVLLHFYFYSYGSLLFFSNTVKNTGFFSFLFILKKVCR